ncbi:hypothetical protein MIND_01337300 [Mycena indigotica]|uniref:F-box domain-containing protein n=1 Tax=Mycena indigotica TaxID=2126181 RepID=A0A8H6VSC6_9AGAR|nr:uncharacterized protein MIND_01337300 [Mycena indigotica]KAF7290236.1 hypothetical protein MIND_01337300 [Mycena indigotica]
MLSSYSQLTSMLSCLQLEHWSSAELLSSLIKMSRLVAVETGKSVAHDVCPQESLFPSTTMVAPPACPRLPLDLERDVFELTAMMFPETRSKLTLVAHRVRSWIEPLSYKSLSIASLHDANRVLSISQSPHRAPDFLASTVRRLVLSRESHFPTRILALCSGITHLALEDELLRDRWSDIHATFLDLANVQRLAIAANEIRRRNTHAGANIFARLTHLTLLDVAHAGLPEFVAALPALTHLALASPPDCGTVQDFLARCPHLRVLVLLAPSPEWAADAGAKPRLLTDDRLVILEAKSWDEGVSDGDTFWTVAQSFVAEKRRTGHSSLCAARA